MKRCYMMAFRLPVVAESEREARNMIAELCEEGDACNYISDSDPFVTKTGIIEYGDGRTYPMEPDWFIERISVNPDEINAHDRGEEPPRDI